MHAMLVTFTSAADLADLADPFADYAQAVRELPGLISKTWLNDGTTIGGFHIFEDRATAEAYLRGELITNVTGNPAFSGFEIRHFDVLDELSHVTGSPSALVSSDR
jgi:hypothetical protein